MNEERVAQLRQLFPEAFANGELDCEKLKASVAADAVSARGEKPADGDAVAGQEKSGLGWRPQNRWMFVAIVVLVVLGIAVSLLSRIVPVEGNATITDATDVYANSGLSEKTGTLESGARVEFVSMNRVSDACSVKYDNHSGYVPCDRVATDDPTALSAPIRLDSYGLPNDGLGSSGGSRPSDSQEKAAKREMAEWAEGRWLRHSAYWDAEAQRFILSALAYSDANSVAIDGYCRIMKDIAREHLQGVNVSAGVMRDGQITVCR
jgi:hypothetical protein